MVDMTQDEALYWYKLDRFTADEVCRATGLSERAQRELLKVGVMQAAPQGTSRVRLVSARMVKRGAVIAALNQCGLNVWTAGRIVYAAPDLEQSEFPRVDPLTKPDQQMGWSDYEISIINARYVMGHQIVYGELERGMARFKAWGIPGSPDIAGLANRLERDRSMDDEVLRTFEIVEASDDDRMAADRARKNPVASVTVNATRALRGTLQRLLDRGL